MMSKRRVWCVVLMLWVLGCTISTAAEQSPVYPLKASADRRYLVDQRDNPYLIQGDAPWALLYAASFDDAKEFLDARRLGGYNTMQVLLLPQINAKNITKPIVPPFRKPNDLSTPNEAYFSRVDRLLRMGAERGMQFSINPIWFATWQSILRQNGIKATRKFGEYVGRRYAKFDNILWLEGGDLHGCDDSMRPYLDAFVDALATADRRHLQTVHVVQNEKNLEQQYIREPWYSLFNVYYYSPIQDRAMRARNIKPPMPFFLSEACYEGEHPDWNPPGTAWRARVQAYCAVLCGASGHVLGATPTLYWFHDDWRKLLDTPMYRTIPHLTSLFASRPWYTMMPDGNPKRELVIAGSGSAWDYIPAAWAKDGSFAIVYLPKPKTITVDMTKLSGPTLVAWWFNPRDGKAALAGTYPSNGLRQFSPPSSGVEDDWVLVLDNAAKNLSKPRGLQ